MFQDTLSWIHGRHSLRFGGGLTRAQNNQSKYIPGAYSIFLNYPGLLLGQAPLNPFETVDLAGIFGYHWRTWDGDLYAQDDIKVTSRLTLNLGFRYERLGDPGEIDGNNVTMDPSAIDPNPPASGSLAGIVVSRQLPGHAAGGSDQQRQQFGDQRGRAEYAEPAVGFAWSLPGTQRLVLRGGYGVYHQRTYGSAKPSTDLESALWTQQEVAPNFFNGFANPFPPDPGAFPQFFPYSPSTAFSPWILDLNLRPPIFQRYSLSLQTQIARDFVLEIGYAGMRGTHMLMVRDINEASLASAANPIRGETTTTVAKCPIASAVPGLFGQHYE